MRALRGHYQNSARGGAVSSLSVAPRNPLEANGMAMRTEIALVGRGEIRGIARLSQRLDANRLRGYTTRATVARHHEARLGLKPDALERLADHIEVARHHEARLGLKPNFGTTPGTTSM